MRNPRFEAHDCILIAHPLRESVMTPGAGAANPPALVGILFVLLEVIAIIER